MTKPKRPKLPAPRLQLRWAKDEGNARGWPWACHYELVMPLDEHDIRREVYGEDGEVTKKVKEFVVAMKEPSLRQSNHEPCSGPDGSQCCDPPYRDGAHALWDSTRLGGLPVYVIAPNGVAFKHEMPK